MMDKPKAILFDLDNTLLAWSDTIAQAWESLCSRHSARLGDTSLFSKTILDALSTLNAGSDPPTEQSVLLRQAVSNAFRELGIEDMDLAAEIADAHESERVEISRPLPGTTDTLRYFKEEGVKLALITSGSGERQRGKVKKHGLEVFFDVILIEGEIGYGKPEERVYLEALEQLGVTPSETWMVGDGLEWDIETAQKLGILGIWVVWPASKYILMDLPPDAYPENSHVRPDRIIQRVSELRDLV